MSQIKFYKVTQSQYDALETPDEDAVYFTSDTLRIYAQKKNYSCGIIGDGHVIGGYTVPVFGYEESNSTYTLLLSPEADAVDFSRFSAGQNIKISLVREILPETGEMQFSYVDAEILSVDAEKFRMTLKESLYGGNITSSTRIGLKKTGCSGYTDKATDGPSAYRITLSNAESAVALFRGRKIYTRAGSENLIENTVSGMNGKYLYLSAAAAGATAIYYGNPNVFLTDMNPDEANHETTNGICNFVSGESAAASGGWNIVIGTTSNAFGNSNTVLGSMANAVGSMNFVAGDTSFATGVSNEIYDRDSFAVGSGNKLYYQSEIVIGSGNEVSGINSFVIGNMNKISSFGGIVWGQSNEVTGKYSLASGFRNKVAAQSAHVFGRYADVEDLPENKNAFIFNGGEYGDSAEVFSVRCFKSVLNPQYDSSKDPAGSGTDSTGEKQYIPGVSYSLQYRGRLLPVSKTIVLDSQTENSAVLDHDRYAKWELSGSGAVTLSLANWINGDRGELLLNTENQIPTFPQDWIIPNSFDITTTPGVYLLELRKENNSVYMHRLLPFQ